MIWKSDFRAGWIHEFTSNGGNKSKYLVMTIQDVGIDDAKYLLYDADGLSEIGWFNLKGTFQNGYKTVKAIKKFVTDPVFGTDDYLKRMGIR